MADSGWLLITVVFELRAKRGRYNGIYIIYLSLYIWLCSWKTCNQVYYLTKYISNKINMVLLSTACNYKQPSPLTFIIATIFKSIALVSVRDWNNSYYLTWLLHMYVYCTSTTCDPKRSNICTRCDHIILLVPPTSSNIC